MVSTVDLIDGLSSGKIRGATLDVLENEQFSLYTTKEKEVHEALMAFEDRVLITPHIAGWTKSQNTCYLRCFWINSAISCKRITLALTYFTAG